MLKYIIILSGLFFLQCEEKTIQEEQYSCKECISVYIIDGVKVDSIIGFYCGEELKKQEQANFKEKINNHIVETKTICTKVDCKY